MVHACGSWKLLPLTVTLGAGVLACRPTVRSTERLPGAALPASAVEVYTALNVSRASRDQGDSVVITVTARNPRWWPVRVDLGGPGCQAGSDPKETFGLGFGYRLAGSDGSPSGPATATWGQRVVWFGPRMGWRHRFVLHVSPAERAQRPALGEPTGIAPGRYAVVGTFGTSAAVGAPLEVLP